MISTPSQPTVAEAGQFWTLVRVHALNHHIKLLWRRVNKGWSREVFALIMSSPSSNISQMESIKCSRIVPFLCSYKQTFRLFKRWLSTFGYWPEHSRCNTLQSDDRSSPNNSTSHGRCSDNATLVQCFGYTYIYRNVFCDIQLIILKH